MTVENEPRWFVETVYLFAKQEMTKNSFLLCCAGFILSVSSQWGIVIHRSIGSHVLCASNVFLEAVKIGETRKSVVDTIDFSDFS